MRLWRCLIALAIVVSTAPVFPLAARAADGDPAKPSTPYLDRVAQALRRTSPGTEGTLWTLTYGNKLEPNWLLQTPNCWGDGDCGAGGSKEFVAAVRSDIANAHDVIDLVTLYPLPEADYQDAIVEGLRAVIASGRRPLVRMLFGVPPTQAPWLFGTSPRQYLSELNKRLGGAANPLKIAVGYSTTSWPMSWNHAKMLAVDGRTIITGGHNFRQKAYLVPEPISDVSMRIVGPATIPAHNFANLLWNNVCDHDHGIWNRVFHGSVMLSAGMECPRNVTVTSEPVGDVAAMALGSSGLGLVKPSPEAKLPPSAVYDQAFDSKYFRAINPGRRGMQELILSAKKSVVISQQDILGIGYGIEAILHRGTMVALARKVIQKVPIRVILTTPGARIGFSDSYSFSWPLTRVAKVLARFVTKEGRVDRTAAEGMVCDDLQLASIRRGKRPTWASGKLYGNHAKIILVDDRAFYLGTENLYPSRLQEWGYIVDDAAASATLRRDYLDPLWNYSAPGAAFDYERKVCPFK